MDIIEIKTTSGKYMHSSKEIYSYIKNENDLIDSINIDISRARMNHIRIA